MKAKNAIPITYKDEQVNQQSIAPTLNLQNQYGGSPLQIEGSDMG